MTLFDRREFARGLALLAAASAARPAPAADPPPAKRGPANDRLRVAVIGVRQRGKYHVAQFHGRANIDVAAVCDCDETVLGPVVDALTTKRGEKPAVYKDVRALLDDKSIDAVTIATPNHWHATMAVWAMRAGKHVYVEKPCSHNVREGRAIVETAAKTGKVCQVGTQSRSMTGMREAVAFVHAGGIGDISLAYGTCYNRRESIGRTAGPQPVPKGLDYDLWCGPAKVLPPRRNGQFGPVHYDWHWTWEYGNGDIGNQGVHELDKIVWGLRKTALPKSVVCLGGRLGYADDGETPNTQLALFDYGDVPLVYELRGLETKDYKGSMNGHLFFGTKGFMVFPSYQSATAFDPDGHEVRKFNGGSFGEHVSNWAAAVRANDPAKVNAPPAQGHVAAALCHLANVSYRVGVTAPLAAKHADFDTSPAVRDALARLTTHLKENGVDPAKTNVTVGPRLTVDPATEAFVGGPPAATALLGREARKGFELG